MADLNISANANWKGDSVSIQHPQPGQIIKPSLTSASSPSPTNSMPITSDHSDSTPPIQLTNGVSYAVAHGDSFGSIASAHDMTPAQLQALNPDLHSQTIHPGQLLNLVAEKPSPGAIAPQPVVGPTQSSYTMANTKELEAAVHKEIGGWAAPGYQATDPAHNLVEAAQKPKTDTDPLKINHK